MFFWFLGTAIATVWFVFRDPQFDYRLLCVGAIAPDLFDIWFGGARALHTLSASIAALLVVVIASAGRKRWRKRALAIPIGMLLHLVFDGAFTNADLFWWPVSGIEFADDPLPSAARGWFSAFNLALEAVGLVLLAWAWRTFGLRSPARRAEFIRTGALRPLGATASRRW